MDIGSLMDLWAGMQGTRGQLRNGGDSAAAVEDAPTDPATPGQNTTNRR